MPSTLRPASLLALARPALFTVGALSFAVNLLLVPALFMLQVFDRVLTSLVCSGLNPKKRSQLGADGKFKPADVMKAEFNQLLAGRDPSTVVHHCGSGVSAVPNLLAMQIAGLGATGLFAGSWSEWVSDPSRPVAQG